MPQEAWDALRGDKNAPVEWIRFRQKQLPKKGVFADGEFHCGAHMNLMVFTDNPKGLRSEEAEERQKKNKLEKWLSRPWSQSRPRWHESDWKDDSWRHQ